MTFRDDRRSFVLAAGGTGGHMFPAEALARELTARGEKVVLVTDRRGQAFGRDLAEVEVQRIRSATLQPGLMGKLRTAIALIQGYGQARGLLRSLNPAVVVGFGSYASAPTVFAAGRLGLPVLLHEQNAHVGRANRLVAGAAKTIATGFPEVAGLKPADQAKCVAVGNPVRPAIAALATRSYTPPPPDGPIRLLVTGGSQGTHVFSDLVPAAIGRLPESLRARLAVVQQCRKEDLTAARRAYAELGLHAELSDFFTDMPERLAACHLAITRAGASTVAELAVAGRPAILVPYPHATDDHQTANARALAAAGGAVLMPQPDATPDALAGALADLAGSPDRLVAASTAARSFA
ncbi:MAG: undecaprenyldiphospho-muramoylpentapeptide beta-N-acetylglucosaminyltransferase, partial [Alphaproteobacteria bacterium]|nr:undecaprenyldiphospho-muramoylpentapeptide beta-N-acetylglucosaminyltransferase [Alphaproteobacteria bacterium]